MEVVAVSISGSSFGGEGGASTLKTGFVPGVDVAIVYYAAIGSWEGPLVRFTFRS